MSLPKGHIATNRDEIRAHGPHVDLIAGTDFGSHQLRVGPDGRIFEDQFNFSGRRMPGLNGPCRF